MRSMRKISRFVVSAFCIAVLFAMSLSTIVFAVESTDTSKSDSVLYGKTALFCGDSICAAKMDGGRGWAGRIGDAFGMSVINNGKGGASVSTCRGENRVIAQIDSEKGNQYDYVVLHGGVNDAMEAAPIGTISDSFDITDFDPNTFAGGLEELFYYTNEYFGEETIIGYIVNYQTPKSEWGGETKDMSAYFDAAIQICDKWDMPYLDLYNDEEFNNNLMKVTTDENLSDFLHPNSGGYEILYPPIAAWIEDISLTPALDNKLLYWIIAGIIVIISAGVVVYVIKRNKKV